MLFDAVGTVIRLREPVGETYARFAGEAGVALDPAAVQAAFVDQFRRQPPMLFPGLPAAAVAARERGWWFDLVRAVFAQAGAGAADLETCFARLFDHYAGAAAWQCAPGAAALLGALRERGLATGMVSNFDHRLHRVLDALGLRARLDVVVLPADAGAAKPDARIFAFALARLGVRAEETVYVGDDPDDDLAGAWRAGLRAIDMTALPSLEALDPVLR